MRFADDARRILQNLPQRIPKKVAFLQSKTSGEHKLMARDATVWLHAQNGDPITGVEKWKVRRELFAAEKQEEDEEHTDPTGMLDAAGEKDVGRWAVIEIGDLASHAMPRTYLDGLSDTEFSVASQVGNRCFVLLRWELHGTHTGALFGYPATGRAVTVVGMTLMRFDQTTLENGKELFNGAEEWTYWDLPSLLEQLGGTA